MIEKQVEKKLKEIREDASSCEDFTYWETIQDKLPYFRVRSGLDSSMGDYDLSGCG